MCANSADQHRARRDPGCGRLAWWSPVDLVFCGPLEQAADGGFEAAENSFLKPVGHGSKQKRLTDMDGRFGPVERCLRAVGSSPRSSASSSVRLLVPTVMVCVSCLPAPSPGRHTHRSGRNQKPVVLRSGFSRADRR
jgi:hypothetical protein